MSTCIYSGWYKVVKVTTRPKLAKPNIEDVLQQFLTDSESSSQPTRLARESVIDLFVDCINGYGYQSLSPEETELFEKYYNMKGAKHKEFSEIFGPDKITDNIGNFVDYFLIQKVMSSADFLKKAGTTMKVLSAWLLANGYAENEAAELAIKRSTKAAKNLPRAEKASNLIWDQISATYGMFGAAKLDEAGYMDITKIEPGKLWVTPIGGAELGPISVPERATELLKVGWEINLGLVKVRGKWEVAELGNIYPHQ